MGKIPFENDSDHPPLPREPEPRSTGLESPRGRLSIASCRSGSHLAEKVVAKLEDMVHHGERGQSVPHQAGIDFQFSDGETCVRLERDVNGHDVFLFQALHDPTSQRSVDENYMAFLLAIRSLREWGANHVTGVLPYLAYARQDKPTDFKREPTSVELMADLTIKAGLDRLVVWDPHTARVHGFYGSLPVDPLSPLKLFYEEFKQFHGRDDVIVVAPDAGGAKFIMHLARALNIRSAVASKYRPQPEKAVVSEIMGDFNDMDTAIILDDMINTGGTVSATANKLIQEEGIKRLYLGFSHNLCSSQALERIQELRDKAHLQEMIVTDSIPQTASFLNLPYLKQRSLAAYLSTVIYRVHHSRPVNGLFAEPVRPEEDDSNM